MAVSNSNHRYKIYVSTLPNNGFKDDQSLESPLITFKFNVKAFYLSDKPDKSIPSTIQDHDSWHEFEHHPANEPTRDFLSNLFANITRIIPFSLTNLHWKKRVYHQESVPLMSTDCVITSLLYVCESMISESSRKKLFLIVFIKKEVIVPHAEYLAMLKAQNQEETLQRVENMVRLRSRGWNFRQSHWESMVNEIREAGLGNSIRNALDLVSQRATTESGERAVVRLVPAAATSVQALEKITCNGSKFSEENCSICMEQIVIGSQLVRMPCSHVFHGECITQWLNISHVCPVCRFKLPIE